MFLSSRQAGYSYRQQRQPRPEYKSDKCEVSGIYFTEDGQMAGCWHILTGLNELLPSKLFRENIHTQCKEEHRK